MIALFRHRLPLFVTAPHLGCVMLAPSPLTRRERSLHGAGSPKEQEGRTGTRQERKQVT
ncbi:hypothetical protein ACWGAN_18955 [Streptomyces sp. NPDC054945]